MNTLKGRLAITTRNCDSELPAIDGVLLITGARATTAAHNHMKASTIRACTTAMPK